MATNLAHEPAAQRYTLHVDGTLVATLDYAVSPSAISLTRAYTVPAQRGHGYAADLVAFAVNHIAEHGPRRVIPMCWYVAEWFDAHPERLGLLGRTA